MSNEIGVSKTSCVYVEKNENNDQIVRTFTERNLGPIPSGYARVRVQFSSLNYKDALCATGHPGVAKNLPIVPGIDAAGMVVECPSGNLNSGENVMIFHARFGTKSDGGWSQYVDVPEDWIYRIPNGLDARASMVIGTAGFTAGQCVDELIKHSVQPDSGEVIVTGATGGVGVCAVMLLAKLGYQVIASTGKMDKADWLKSLGAAGVISRSDIDDQSKRPLLKGRWAGAVDTVGGNTLATVLRTTQPYGCVTACGLVGGTDFSISVYPFILRGITLQGIDTAGIPREYRSEIWDRLANDWSLEKLGDLGIETDLENVDEQIEKILAGEIAGRVVVGI